MFCGPELLTLSSVYTKDAMLVNEYITRNILKATVRELYLIDNSVIYFYWTIYLITIRAVI